MAELADAQDLGTCTAAAPSEAQPLVKQTTYDNSHETTKEPLGALLGAFAAEIAPHAPDLARLLTAWPTLPGPIKAAVAALLNVTAPAPDRVGQC